MTSTTTVTTLAPKAPQNPPDGSGDPHRFPITSEVSADPPQSTSTADEYTTVDLWISDATVLANRSAPVQKQPKDNEEDDVQFIAQIKAEPTAAPEDENEEEEENPPASPANPPHSKNFEDHSKDLTLHFSSMQTEQPVPIPNSEPSPKAPNPNDAKDIRPEDLSQTERRNVLHHLADELNAVKPANDDTNYSLDVEEFIAGKHSFKDSTEKMQQLWMKLREFLGEPRDLKVYSKFLSQFHTEKKTSWGERANKHASKSNSPQNETPRETADRKWKEDIKTHQYNAREFYRNEYAAKPSPIRIVPRYKFRYADKKYSKAEVEEYIAAHPGGAVAKSVLSHLTDAEVIHPITHERIIKLDDPTPVFKPKRWEGDAEGCGSEMIWGELDPAKPADRIEFEMLLSTNNPFNVDDEQEYEVTGADAVRTYGNIKTSYITIIHIYMAGQWWWVDAAQRNLYAWYDRVRALAFDWIPPATEEEFEEKWSDFEADYHEYADAIDLTSVEREMIRIQTGQTIDKDGEVHGKPETNEKNVKVVPPGSELVANTHKDRADFRILYSQKTAEKMTETIKKAIQDKDMRNVPHHIVVNRLIEIREHFWIYGFVPDQIDIAIQRYTTEATPQSINEVYRAYYQVEQGIRNDAYHVYKEYEKTEKEFISRVRGKIPSFSNANDDSQDGDPSSQNEFQAQKYCIDSAKRFLSNIENKTIEEGVKLVDEIRQNLDFDMETNKIHSEYRRYRLAYKKVINPESLPKKQRFTYDEEVFKNYMRQIIEFAANYEAKKHESENSIAVQKWFGSFEDIPDIHVPEAPPKIIPSSGNTTAPNQEEKQIKIWFNWEKSSDDEQPAPSSSEEAPKKRAPKGTYSAKTPADKPAPAKRPQTAGKSPGKHPGKTARKTIQTPSQLNHPGKN